ncbi:3-isopropylmalate/(R)-2-methylmalate dehydratase small subunit [Blattabacterium sp. (Blatta orientalis) str. Tarazona]|uniref:3-isopropylmalate dehydratase small subunit n=1 Tax=Blattabacterium sp. (Blatta orientalis) TaxID=367806 RepID=UPI0002AD9B7A|nr:3-isopropylmalate dehydratase small subunit [Blattabacterium sp. (Blatta orientalis)]AGD97982.1 3-isopropylmalate/(R)-2-methylmalate dehydratase small subunit [Blattabacterium sp. (Blatta orientalis) str. Tarazona]
MKKFTVIISKAIPLPVEDIDTDQIIPARFLKETKREEYGKNLFRDWRYSNDGSLKKDFILNNPLFSGKILLSGRNFGCGSSREHAAWALFDYGFQVVISSFFADIFKENALNNGLLTVEISEKFLKNLFDLVNKKPDTNIKVDLIEQLITIMETGISEKFSIHPYKKNCFINGYDDIDFLVSIKKDIENFRKKRNPIKI